MLKGKCEPLHCDKWKCEPLQGAMGKCEVKFSRAGYAKLNDFDSLCKILGQCGKSVPSGESLGCPHCTVPRGALGKSFGSPHTTP